MRVTITVEGVQREIEVRPDLLLPGMGEWQDATEMDLLRAFGHAYKEAVARGLAAAAEAAQTAEQAAGHTDEGVGVQEAVGDNRYDVSQAPVEAPVEVPVDLLAEAPADPVSHAPVADPSEEAVLDYDPEAAVVDDAAVGAETGVEPTPFAANEDEGFGQVETYIATESDADAFLTPVPSPAMAVPEVTQCRCGHAIGWHVSDTPEQAGQCLTVWAIDDHDPTGPQARCSCLRFEPADVRPPLA